MNILYIKKKENEINFIRHHPLGDVFFLKYLLYNYFSDNMKFNIICTQDDDNYNLYKDKVNNRKVIFHIKDIFLDNWNNFLNSYPNLKIRDVVYKNVKKILQCKTFDLGYSEYECPNCHKSLIVPNTCKSRFCSSCGNKYNESRSISIYSKLFKHPHRHVVFTIPKELRNYFCEDDDFF